MYNQLIEKKNEYLIFTNISLDLVLAIVITFFLLLAEVTCSPSKHSEYSESQKSKCWLVYSSFHFEAIQSQNSYIQVIKVGRYLHEAERWRFQYLVGVWSPHLMKRASARAIDRGRHLWGEKGRGGCWGIRPWMESSGSC